MPSHSLVTILMPDVSAAYSIMSVFGAAWAGLYWFSTDLLAQYLAIKELEIKYKKGYQLALPYTSSLLRGKAFKGIIGSWAIFIVPTIPIFSLFVPAEAAPYLFAGFGLMTLILIGVNGRKWMKKFKIGASDKVVRFFLNRGKKSEIDEILALTFRQKLPEIQQISIKGMGEWGSKKSILHLEEAIESNDSETSSLAKKTYQQISKRLSANRPYLVKPLATLFEEYEHWYIKAEEHAAIPLEKQKYIGKREGIARSIEQIISSQMHIRNHYPDLYCMECKTKAEELIHRKWRYVRCKTCREALDLHTEIENVTGIIGPMPEPMEGVYYLELWNENLSASQVGELDQIEIRPGADFNYNWAVSAVVEGLQNRWPDVDLALPVKLDPTIQLQANTLTLLKSIRQGG